MSGLARRLRHQWVTRRWSEWGLARWVLGVVGYKLFRLWVGVAAAALFAVIAGSAVGYNDVWPQLADYGPPPAVSAPSVAQASAASSGDAEDRGAALGQWWSQQRPALDQWARGFWDHAKTQNQNVGRNVTLSVLFAAIVGLGLGIFASRLTAVTITSVAGTLLLTGGATALVRAWRADVYNNAMNQPAMMGAALGIFLLASFSLQMLLTRSDKPAKSGIRQIRLAKANLRDTRYGW